MTASARFCDRATCAASEPLSSAKPCSLTSQFGCCWSHAACLSSVTFAVESSSAELAAKKVRRPTLRMKSSSLPGPKLAKPAAGSLVLPNSFGFTAAGPGLGVGSMSVVEQAASAATRLAASSRLAV